MKSYVKVQAGHEAPAETVSHAFYQVAKHLKTALLLELLGNTRTGAVLVFMRTKHRARQLGGKLAKAGYRSASLQGNLSQSRRQEVMDGFKSGKYEVLVATDIAARGIDVSNVSHAINYDMPSTPEAYIHRIGRTGRATRSGKAFTLITDEDRQMLKAVHGAVRMPVEQRTLAGFNYRAPIANTRHTRRSAQQLPSGWAGRRQNRRSAEGAFTWLSLQKPKAAGRRVGSRVG